jgi:hypothetical protein
MAAPTVRNSKETKKAAASELTVVLPAGTEAGDFLVLFAVSRKETTPPTITTPSGWTLQGAAANIKGATVEDRECYVFTRECASGAETALLKASAEATALYGLMVAITKGTFNTTTPVNVHSEWVEEATTEPKLPSVTTTTAECLALGEFSVSSAITTGPEEGWELVELSTGIYGGDVYKRTITAAEATPKGKAKKTGSKVSGTFTIAIAPVSGKKTVEEAAVVRAGTAVVETAVKIATEASAVAGGARLTATAAKVATGAATLLGGARVATTVARSVVVASSVRAGAVVAQTARLVATATPVLRAGARVAVSVAGQKIVEAAAAMVAGARTIPQAIKIATSSPTVRAGARTTTTAKLVATAATVLRAGGRVLTASRVTFKATALVRAGARIVLLVIETLHAQDTPTQATVYPGATRATVQRGRTRAIVQGGRARATIHH